MTVPGAVSGNCNSQCAILDSVHVFNRQEPHITGTFKICTDVCFGHPGAVCGTTLTCTVNAPYYRWMKQFPFPGPTGWEGYGTNYQTYYATQANTYWVEVGNGPSPDCSRNSGKVIVNSGSCNVYVISPNPGHSQIMVKVDHTVSPPSTKIHAIKVLDRTGAVRMQYQYAGVQSANLDVSSLSTDVYTAEISDGTTWTSMQFIKQ
jgi:hypothetical protein